MCFYHDEYADVSTDKLKVARKEHKCGDCGGVIRRGEKYRHTTFLFEGEWSTSKECRRCAFDRLRIIQHELAEGCHRSEAEPALESVGDAIIDYGWKRTPVNRVPADFDFERDVPAVSVVR